MKVILKEEQQEKIKLPPFIYKAIVNKNTSIGDNEALPPFGDFGMEYAIARKGLEEADEVINNCIKNGRLESKDTDYLLTVLNKKVDRCRTIEATLKPQLEKLCENIVNTTLSIPNETISLKCELVGKIKPEHDVRILPESDEDGNTYDFNDVDEVELTNKVISKRRFINALIQGLSYWLSTDLDDWYDTVAEINEELWGLWYDIKHISDYLLYTKKDSINEKHPNLLAYVEVRLGRRGKKTEIHSQGIIFPYLLRDTFRGLLELFSAHSLPRNNEKAMYIIKKADFLVAEPWDLRLGKGFVDMLHNSLTKKYQTNLLFKTSKIPFFFSRLCQLKTDEFNSVMKNFLLGTKKGNIIAKEMDAEITHNIDYQKFKDRIQQKNIKTSVINDGDFSKEELDGYVLQENEVDEMMAYHGTGADFDKFNHKKFLNTGAGSQSFGWGTYVTNDAAVANGYSNSVGKRVNIGENIIRDVMLNVFHYEDNEETENIIYHIMRDLRAVSYKIEDYIDIMKRYSTSNAMPQKAKEFDAKILEIITYIYENGNVTNSILYEVDIPEDNGTNYIEWYEEFPSEFMRRILEGFLRLYDSYLDSMAESDYPFRCDLYQDIKWMKQNPDRAYKMIEIISNGDYEDFFSSSFYTNKALTDGKSVYRRLQSIFFGKDKAASLFLMQCGFDGIKYPSGTRWRKPDGASEDAYNYVIFDANKVKIINKTKV